MPTDTKLERLRRVAWWLDAGIPIPGTSLRIGLDAIIGLIPGFGDATGAVAGAWIIIEGARFGVPASTLLRMTGNVLLDMAIGTIPILGDLFDAGWKSNLRNVELLERHAANPAKARRSDTILVVALVGGVLAVGIGAAVASVLVARWLFQLASAY